jgi:2-polyprenyl-3-methyl-5-hydroxy-6-metoxy-1,4-benzoquinol methylase
VARKAADFSHRDKFSGYMGGVVDAVAALVPDGAGKALLDIPAGAGKLGDAFAERGFKVTYCDFNRDRPDFVPADFNLRLPFGDASFDVVTSCEGIEHALSDLHVVSEFARVCRPGGTVVLTTPNVHSCSRGRSTSSTRRPRCRRRRERPSTAGTSRP